MEQEGLVWQNAKPVFSCLHHNKHCKIHNSCQNHTRAAQLLKLFILNSIHQCMDAADTAATLEEFAQNLRTGRNLDEKREALLHTMACKAAIKGGWTSDPAELKILVEKVQSGEVRYCPHGRPVVVKVTKYELEKLFKRA